MEALYAKHVGKTDGGASSHQSYFPSLPTLMPIGPSMYAENVKSALLWCVVSVVSVVASRRFVVISVVVTSRCFVVISAVATSRCFVVISARSMVDRARPLNVGGGTTARPLPP